MCVKLLLAVMHAAVVVGPGVVRMLIYMRGGGWGGATAALACPDILSPIRYSPIRYSPIHMSSTSSVCACMACD